MNNLNTGAGFRRAYIRWEPPDEAISVDVHMNIVQQLDRDAVRAGDNIAAGLLLGRIEAGRLIVEAAEAATPEIGEPESPFTNLWKLEPILDRWRSGQKRISIVGLYRSSGRCGSVLNKDDFAALRASTSATETVAQAKNANRLAMKDSIASSKQSTENEQVRGWSPLGSQLTKREQLFLLIEPCVDRASSATLYLTSDGAILRELALMPFNRTQLSKQQATSKQRPAENATAPRDPLLQEDEIETHAQEREPVPGMRGRYHTVATNWGWLLALTVIAVLGSFFALGGSRQQLRSLDGHQKSNDNHLGLKLQRTGNDWELRWDQDAPILLDGRKGHLRITDGGIRKELELSPSELRNGRIIYAPMTDDVAMELEVESPQSEKPFAESVRILAGLLPAQASQGATMVSMQKVPSKTLWNSRTADFNAPSYQATTLDATPSSKTIALTHSRSAMAKMPLEHKIEDDYKNVEGQSERANEPSMPFSDRSPFLEGAEMIIPLSSPPAPSGGKTEPARLISRSDPLYPPFARFQRIAGTVEVNFGISAKGEVKDVTAKGPAVLTQAAVEAVRKSRYAPARLNGVSVETKATTVVAFRLN